MGGSYKTIQDCYKEAVRNDGDVRIPRSKLVDTSLNSGASVGGINYRQDGIGYEYNDTNNFFETEYLQTLSKNSSVESITHALSPSESNTSFHSSNDRKLPEPLASVMDDIENGTLSEHDPPNISPSKEEVEAYLANIPGMKMFSPRAPRDPRAELPVNAKACFCCAYHHRLAH